MTIPSSYEKQIRSLLKNIADIRNFVSATSVYYRESTGFLKTMMTKAGIEYSTDLENLRLPFQDEALSYAFTQLITQLMQYEQSSSYLNRKLDEFDLETSRQFAQVFSRDDSDEVRKKTLLDAVDGIEELTGERQNLIALTVEIEKTIKLLEIWLSALFN